MIVSPNKGVFFVATALMCSASLYGAELSTGTDPMARIFVGEPHRLTVPPGFPSDVEVLQAKAVDQQVRDCQADASVVAEGAKSLNGCAFGEGTIASALAEPPRASNGLALKSEAVAQPVSTASAARAR
jgi:hypothetical protein